MICKMKNLYILLTLLLITTILLIAVTIYCCLIKYKTKQKHLLPFYDANSKENWYQKYIINTESHELKAIDITNWLCYYFDDIIKIEDFDFYNISIDEKIYKNILVYDISFKTLFGSKPLCIRFDEVSGFIRV